MKRTGSAVWQGDLKTGKGTVSTESGVLSQVQYSFGTRFESGKGTNPEELIAAAHAGCFTHLRRKPRLKSRGGMHSGCPPKPWQRRTRFGGFRRSHKSDPRL
jgi:hypothetical protein